MKTALILGIGGQDGSYLADILLEKGYSVHGLYRRSSSGNLRSLSHCLDRLTLHEGDVTDLMSVIKIVRDMMPDEIYHEADQDNVDWSLKTPSYSMDVTVKGCLNLLEAARSIQTDINPKVFIPVSATMFGNAPSPQNESTPFNPLSPYACGKVAAYHLARYYRQAHGMFVSTAILYNHDSPRRNGNYLLHKICKAAVSRTKITMFNLEDEVDIGYAKDYMNDVFNIMQLKFPDDFVICSRFSRTVRQIVEFVYRQEKLDYRDYVTEDTNPLRPGPTPTLVGDMTKYLLYGLNPNTTLFDFVVGSIIEKYRRESR